MERTWQTSSAPGSGGWQPTERPQQVLSDRCEPQWSQAETATAAAAIWRQQQQQIQQQRIATGSFSPSVSATASGTDTAEQTEVPPQPPSPEPAEAPSSSLHNGSTNSFSGVNDSSGGDGLDGSGGLGAVSGASSSARRSTADHTGVYRYTQAAADTNCEAQRRRRREAWEMEDGLTEKERQRRERIGQTKRGRTPWNKGLGEVQAGQRFDRSLLPLLMQQAGLCLTRLWHAVIDAVVGSCMQ